MNAPTRRTLSDLMDVNESIAAGIGAVLTALALAIREWVKRGATPAAILEEAMSSPDDIDPLSEQTLSDARKVLKLNAYLQEAGTALGADSALLLLWEPTVTGGKATVLAEWPGNLPPSSLKYQRTELGPSYKRDVIDRLKKETWLVLRPTDLSAGSNLRDLYESRRTAYSWLHIVLLDDDGSVLYTSLRFPTGAASLADEADYRVIQRKLAEQICHTLSYNSYDAS